MTQRPFNMHVGIYTKTLCDDLRKGLLITLTLLFVCPGVWGKNINVNNTNKFGTLTDGKYTLVNGNTYTLSQDVTTEGYIYVPSGATVTIELNDHTIDRGLFTTSITNTISNGYVIYNEGILTINSQDEPGNLCKW